MPRVPRLGRLGSSCWSLAARDVPSEHLSSALHVNAELYEDPQRAEEVAEHIRQALRVPTTAV